MDVGRARLAEQLVNWASGLYGPYGESYKKNMVLELYKSKANLGKLWKSDSRSKMHDINFIVAHQMPLFCGTYE